MKRCVWWIVPALVLGFGLVLGGCKLSRDIDGVAVPDVVPGTNDTGGGEDTPTGGEDASAEVTIADAALPDGTDGAAPMDGVSETAAPGQCRPPAIDPATIELPEGDFAHPFDVAVSDDYVFVANANVSSEIGPGFVTVIDRATRAVLNRIPTTQPIPVALALHGQTLVVVNQGITDDSTGVILPEPAGGGVDILDDVATAATAATFDHNIAILPAGTVGVPHTIDIASDGRAYIGSGSAPAVFVIDVPGCELLRGADEPVALAEALDQPASLTPRVDGDDRVWIADEVSSLVHVYDATAGTLDDAVIAGAPFDVSQGDKGGPVDIDFHEGATSDVLVLLGAVGSVSGIDSASGAVTAAVWPGGRNPAAAHVAGDLLYVLDRSEHALARGDLGTGEERQAFALLAIDDGPNRFAVTGDGAEAWVANADSGTVAVIDLTIGAVTAVVGAEPIEEGCAAPAAAPGALPGQDYAAPTAVLFAGGFVFVTNTNPDAGGVPGQGFVTVLHPDTLETLNRIPTTQPNPRFLASDGRWLYVVNTGVVATDPGSGLEVAQGEGGVDVIDIRGVVGASGPVANVPLAPSATDPRIGAPGALYLSGEGNGFLGSSTGPFLFKLDLSDCQVHRGTDDPIVLDAGATGNEAVTPGEGLPGKVAAVLAEAGRLLMVDARTNAIDGTDFVFDGAAGTLGASDVVYRAGGSPNLFVLLARAAWVASVDTEAAVGDEVTTEWAAAGTGPVHMRSWGDYLYLVDEAADRVRRIHMDVGDAAAPFLVLAAGAGPRDMATGELRSADWRAWVTNRAANTVSAFLLSDGSPLP